MDIIAILWLAVSLIGISKQGGSLSTTINEEYLSKDNCNYYRGIFAVAVILHHVAQRTTSGFIFHDAFCNIGPLCVAVFFFISGYGLQKSYSSSTSYSECFLFRRLPNVLFPYICITIICWAEWLLFGTFYSLKDVIVAIVYGNPIVPFSWYIITITAFYVFFWMLMKLCPKPSFLMIIGAAIGYILYALFCIKMGYGSWWYITVPAVVLSMFWALYEKEILYILQKNSWLYWMVYITSALGFLVLLFKFDVIYSTFEFKRFGTILVIMRNLLFVFNLVLFMMKFKIGNRVLAFLGEISLELYLAQGVFIEGPHWGIQNEFVWCLYVLFATIVAAYIFHDFNKWVLSHYRTWLNAKIC